MYQSNGHVPCVKIPDCTYRLFRSICQYLKMCRQEPSPELFALIDMPDVYRSSEK